MAFPGLELEWQLGQSCAGQAFILSSCCSSPVIRQPGVPSCISSSWLNFALSHPAALSLLPGFICTFLHRLLICWPWLPQGLLWLLF